MEEQKNKKIKNNNINAKKKFKITNKKKLIVAALIGIILIIGIIILLINLFKGKEQNFVDAMMQNNYYIKVVEVNENLKAKSDEYIISRNGEDVVIMTNTQTLIQKGEVFIQLFHEHKLAAIYEKNSNMNNINIGVNNLVNNEKVETTYENINGQDYRCDIYKDGMKIYYLKDEVKYIYNESGILEIVEFEGKVKEELFEIPEDYTVPGKY